MTAAPPTRIVNCDGCRLCCIGERIRLFPEHGDKPGAYVTIRALDPLTGEEAWFIPQVRKACHYLGESGCTIWEDRPAICRAFSCSDAFLNTPRHVRRQRVRDGVASKELYDRGRDVLRAQREESE